MIAKLGGKRALAGPGDDAKGDQRPEVPGEGGAEAAGQEEPEADQQHPLLAELVAEAAEDRRQHRAPIRGSRSGPRSSRRSSSRTPPGRSGSPGKRSFAAGRTQRRRG